MATPGAPRQALFDRRFARNLWRLTRIYWTSPAAKQGALLLALAIAFELGAVYGNVLIADAQKKIFDAVQDKQMSAFLAAMGGFFGIVLAFVLVSAYRVYVRQWLEMHWRESVTAHYVEAWIGPQAYCQRELHLGEADNPDQRIAEDIRNFVASSLGLSLSLLAALATLVSFAGLLWNLSADWPLEWRGEPLHIPGLMMWIAIIYAFLAMGLTHLVGRPLVPINFNRMRVEADFRYGLVRFRENVEAVALARGARFEQRGALHRFQYVMQNWWQLIAAQRRLSIFTAAIGQANAVLPVLIAAPAYFSGWMTLGSVAQTRVAYGQVSGALAWFVYAYQEIAQWRASVERLSTFAEVVDAARADLAHVDGIQLQHTDGNALRLSDLRLTLPDKRVLVDSVNATVSAGDRVAVLGSAGAGKTTLFRAIAGIWSFGSGRIEIPIASRSIFLPQRPYLPIGTLREVVSYPAEANTFPDEKIGEALALLDLNRLTPQLDETAQWEQQLSGDEQQRLSLARVLLHEPNWIFMDDATAALDEAVEKRVYGILA
ncbi:MAG TPA: ABC transporter ATP-binding protein/permease, partial [Candidatus Acidoferrales bacterium]|nr:ABC transporter ATP-binding protein/permease [Candidatus Acidoferrales bacterium]